MALLRKRFHFHTRGAVGTYEDWWNLVFDTDEGEFFVEHEWAHTDVPGPGKTDTGTEHVSLSRFLLTRSTATAKLQELIQSFFVEQASG
jgi:hypothetical protein